MLPNRNTFLATNTDSDCVAICGVHVRSDAVHVGLFLNSEKEKQIIHFLNGDNIPLQNVSEPHFEPYLFNLIEDFPASLLPSLAAIAELISQNKLNGFIFNRVGVVYDGGKFEFKTGSYTAKSPVEKFVNCGVFVLALLNTYNYQLIDWESWPSLHPEKITFLENWLNYQNISEEHRLEYYKMSKEIRGRHILAALDTVSKPSTYAETEKSSQQLIAEIIQNA